MVKPGLASGLPQTQGLTTSSSNGSWGFWICFRAALLKIGYTSKMQALMQQGWGGAQNSAFLTAPQVGPMLWVPDHILAAEV